MGAPTAMHVGGGVLSTQLYAEGCAVEAPPPGCGIVGPLDTNDPELARMAPPDPRIVTTVLQAPTGAFAFEPGTLARIPRALLLGGERDGLFLHGGVQAFDQMAPGTALALYEKAGHNAPTDICQIPAVTAISADCAGPARGFAVPGEAREATVRHTVAWLAVHLGNQPSFAQHLGPGAGYAWRVR
jgi:hypothetical protein